MTSIPFAAKWATYKRSLRNSLSNGKFAGPNGTPNDCEKKPGVSTATLGSKRSLNDVPCIQLNI